MKTIGKVLVLTLAVSLVGVVFGGALPFYNPASPAAEELEKVHMNIEGMTCDGCAEEIKAKLSELPEVEEGTISWKKGIADVKVNKGSDHKALTKAVEDAGFKVTSLECECKGKGTK